MTPAQPPSPWIAVFDLNVTRNSPAGSCVLAEVMGLADDFDITVFSDRFDNDRPDRVRWVRVPLPARPGFLKYVVFHLLAPWALRRHVRERGHPPALIQATQGQFFGADICYPHFCHRAYLANQWKLQQTRGLRRVLRWLSYRYNAFSERRAFAAARCVVAPSAGLIRELIATYPFLRDRVRQIANPVDVDRFARPDGFDVGAKRQEIGIPPQARVLSFAALGDFERKGLGIVFDAMKRCADPALHLLIVGGNGGEIDLFRERAARAGVLAQCTFAGFQQDVRPFLWASDVFVFPSTYEIFSLVLIQAPAAGLPVIATALYGFEEYAVHGENAWVVARSTEAVANAIAEAFSDGARRARIGAAARQVAGRYGRFRFVAAWKSVLEGVLHAAPALHTAALPDAMPTGAAVPAPKPDSSEP